VKQIFTTSHQPPARSIYQKNRIISNPTHMKNKPNMFKSARANVLPLVISLAITGASQAADRFWDNNGGTANDWASTANWSDSVAGGGTVALPGTGDVAVFSATPIQGTAQTINMNGNRSVQGVSVLSDVSAQTTISGGGTLLRTLTIGSAGVVNNSSAKLQIGGGAALSGLAVNTLMSTANVTNNGSGEIVFGNNFRLTAANTVTFNGAGSGTVKLGSINTATNSGKIVVDTSSYELWMRGNGQFSGGLEIKQGNIFSGGHPTNSLGTGSVTLGGTGDASIRLMIEGNGTYSNAIALAGSGALKLVFQDDGDANINTHTLTGGITGSNNLTIDRLTGTGGTKDDTVTFNTGSINHAGSLTHTGTGAEGNLTINSVIGTNVTGVTQNSTAKMVLTATNTYSGATTVEAGTLYVTGELSNSAVTVQTGGTIGSNGANGVLGNGLTIDAGGILNLTGATLGETSSGILSITGGGLTLGNLTFQNITGWDWANAAEGTYQLISGDFTVDWGSTAYLDANSAYDFGNGKKGYFEEGSLNVVVIPEPGAALLGGLGLLALLRRRR
jgi:hypothetical protein